MSEIDDYFNNLGGTTKTTPKSSGSSDIDKYFASFASKPKTKVQQYQEETKKLEEESKRANSFGGLLKNTLKDLGGKAKTIGTVVKDIAKEFPGAVKQVATEPFKNPIQTLQSVTAGAANVGPAVVNLANKILGVPYRLPKLGLPTEDTPESDVQQALNTGSEMYSSFALGQKGVDKFTSNPLLRNVIGNVAGGQIISDPDATLKERAKTVALDTAFGLGQTGAGAILRKLKTKPPLEIPVKDIEPLAQEATKYKSAEEFVKAQPVKDIKWYEDKIAEIKARPKKFGIDNKPVIDLYKEKISALRDGDLIKAKGAILQSPTLSPKEIEIIKSAKSFDEVWDIVKTKGPDTQGMFLTRLETSFKTKSQQIGRDGLKIRTGSYSFDEPSKAIRRKLYDAFGSYATVDEAVKARKAAEVKFVEPIYNKAVGEVKPAPTPKTIKTTPTAVAPKPIDLKSDTKLKSSVFERMKKENPSLEGELGYDAIKLKADAEKAVDLIAKDKQKAYDIAMGKETSNEVTSTAVNIALAEKALQEGNHSLYAKLIKNRSLEQTRRGQEISAERGSVTDNSTARYVKELIASRLEKLGSSYLGNLKDRLRIKTGKSKATQVIDGEVAKLDKQIRNKKLTVKDALKLLDEIACV